MNSNFDIYDYDNDMSKRELEALSQAKVQLYDRFTQIISVTINKIYDGFSGEDLLPYFSELAPYVSRL